MAVYKDPKPTKNGRAWYFKFSYKDAFGATKQYRSKRYLTKKEASDAERMFLVTSTDKVEDNNMTFKDLYDEFRMHNDEIMKDTTKYGYDNKEKFIECFFPVKVKDFNIMQFEQWKREINKLNISLRYKNDIYKFLKSLLNFATDWYGFNFTHVYRKMHNFNNPNEMPKEMQFFTYDEFQRFLSVEEDIKFRCAWQLLYYCGLRIGELKGITWKDIDFENRKLTINKQITQQSCRSKWQFSPPKTAKSNRVLPLTKVLINDLIRLKESDKEVLFGFKDSFFVIGDVAPQISSTITARKNRNCELAGVKQIRIHDFRHSCASLLIYKGANINTVSQFLGHSKIEETLNTYTHLYKNALTDITSLIDEMNEEKNDF